MRVAGIDPGLDGGIAFLEDRNGEWVPPRVHAFAMPVLKPKRRRVLHEPAIRKLFLRYRPDLVVVERVHSMPKQGVASSFSFGASYGLVRGIACGLGLSYTLVGPHDWKRVMLAGLPADAEAAAATRLWPEVDWRKSERARKPHSGKVAAALIGEYGRRKFVPDSEPD